MERRGCCTSFVSSTRRRSRPVRSGSRRHCKAIGACPLYLPKADIGDRCSQVCFGPKADIAGLFDHLVSSGRLIGIDPSMCETRSAGLRWRIRETAPWASPCRPASAMRALVRQISIDLYGHAAGTRPSSTAALISSCGSVTPSEAVRTIRCAIFALVAGVRCDRSIRRTAMSSAVFMILTNSGLKLAGEIFVITGFLKRACRLAAQCDRDASVTREGVSNIAGPVYPSGSPMADAKTRSGSKRRLRAWSRAALSP